MALGLGFAFACALPGPRLAAALALGGCASDIRGASRSIPAPLLFPGACACSGALGTGAICFARAAPLLTALAEDAAALGCNEHCGGFCDNDADEAPWQTACELQATEARGEGGGAWDDDDAAPECMLLRASTCNH